MKLQHMKSKEFETIQHNHEKRITNSSKHNLCHLFNITIYAMGTRLHVPTVHDVIFSLCLKKMCKLFAVV
jgi:hypothetical protein